MAKSFKIVYFPVAKEDILHILDYISLDNPPAAITLIDKIDTSIHSLSLFPYKGTIPRDFYLKSKGYRMLVIDVYIVFYMVNESQETVEIMRVMSSKQNYRTFL